MSSDSTVARIVDAAAADSRSLAVHRPRIQFPGESAPAHPLGSMLFPEAARAWLLTRRDHIAPRTYLDYARHIETVSRCFRSIVLSDITGDSERMLMEQLDYNLLFRWFVGLNMDDAIWDVTVFTKN